MSNIDPNWEISVQDVRTMLERKDDFLLLDVRQPEEFAICKIDGAHLVPLSDLVNRIDEVRTLAKGRPVVAHCHHGGRSMNAAALLRQAGLGTARSMAGGIDLWSLQIDSRVPRY
jgi:rhodanese-related sulfurtransferase